MKKVLLLILICITSLTNIVAQGTINFALAKKLKEKKAGTVDVFIQGDIKTIKELVRSQGGTFKYSAGNIAAATISTEGIGKIISNRAVQRIESFPSHIKPFNDTMLINNNVVPIHNGQGPLTQGYDGKGIVIGFIDTGIDFNHPDFKDSSGNTRIKFLWDQTKPVAGNTPQPYNYGQEWDSTAIQNGNASSHDPTTFGGHGTHVASIAVGNGLSTADSTQWANYKGVAPEADIIMVALDFNSSSSTLVSDAVEYIFDKADAMGKPCVINASLGDQYGSHDGRDLQSQLISNMVDQQPGRALIAAAGNDGTNKFHLGYTVTSDTNFTFFKYTPAAVACYIQVYADTNDIKNIDFAIGADKITPTHSYRGRTGFSKSFDHFQTLSQEQVSNTNGVIGTVNYYGDLLPGGVYLMEFYIETDSTNYNWRLIATGSGKFDCWAYDPYNGVLPSTATMSDSIYYKPFDTDKTIAAGIQCLDNVITVGNYQNRKTYIDYNGNVFVSSATAGELVSSSSHGPTRDGRIKPDICSPGGGTVSAIALGLRNSFIINYPDNLGQGGYHVRSGATSNAAPSVAGVAALYLQKNPTATAEDVKNAIINHARQDQYTTSNGSLPNNFWGYGKLNALDALITYAQLAAASCGSTLTNLTQKIYCNKVTGATNYKYKIEHAATSYSAIKVSSDTSIVLANITGIEYGKTYTVSISYYCNNAWSPFGAVCNITTPAVQPKLTDNSCGATLSNLNQKVYCKKITAATNYKYKIEHAATSFSTIKVSSDTSIVLANIAGIEYGKTYTVSISYYSNNVWSPFGAVCNITTPTVQPKLTDNSCGATLSNLNQKVYCKKIAAATNYKYKIEHAASSYSAIKVSSDTSIVLANIAGIEYGKTYTVSISYYSNNAWSPFGVVCNITTPAVQPKLTDNSCGATLSNLNQKVYCKKIAAATNYKYKIEHAASSYSVIKVSSDTSIILGNIAGIEYGKTYTISISYYSSNVWSAYGATCNVTTVTPPQPFEAGNNIPIENGNNAEALVINEETSAKAINIYPNPTMSTISINGSGQITRFELLNLLGQTMIQKINANKQDNFTIDLSHLPKGTYMLRMKDEQNNISIKKVIRE